MSDKTYSIHEAYRYLANAKQTLRNSAIEYGRYLDSKYVSEAAGIAYLSALMAINVFLLSRGIKEDNLPQSIEEYRKMIRSRMPHNGKLMAALNTAYENLHLIAYYRRGTSVIMVKDGLGNCKKIIEMLEQSLGKSSANRTDEVNEPLVKYQAKKSKKRTAS